MCFVTQVSGISLCRATFWKKRAMLAYRFIFPSLSRYENSFNFLTVRDQEKDIIKGLTLGADDYLTKPFSLPILDARMEAILQTRSQDRDSGFTFLHISAKLFPCRKPCYMGGCGAVEED